jgi:glycosyltransferase involved in cell wall biosynthesis
MGGATIGAMLADRLGGDDARPRRASATVEATIRRRPHVMRRSYHAAGMRIAIEAWAAAEVPAGRGRYVRELLRGLAATDADHEYVLLGRRPWRSPALDERFRWVAIDTPGLRWLPAAARAAAHRRPDLVLATTSYALCGLVRSPCVAVVYDLVAFDPAMRAPIGARAERVTLPIAVRRARALLCISEATRAALVARAPAADETAVAIPLAADPAFGAVAPGDAAVPVRHGIGRPFVLCAATVEPRKNLPRLIEAFAGLPPALRDAHELVLAGARGWQEDETFAAVRRHAGRVRTLGYVEDAELQALYRRAAVFAFPSLGEGFGLPVLEAMAAGTAVLTSNRSSLPEVGGDAARYVDPLDVDDIRAGLAALLSDPAERARLAARGRARAAGFSWARTARETLAVLEAAAAGEPVGPALVAARDGA